MNGIHLFNTGPYFQGHQIIVKTNYPTKQVLKKSDLTRRMVSRSMEFYEYDISFVLRSCIKSQERIDFLVKFNTSLEEECPCLWFLSVDGSSNLKISWERIMPERPGDVLSEQSLCFKFHASNNHVEYEALVTGMKLAREVGATHLPAKSNSQLITNQMNGCYKMEEHLLTKYL